MWLLASSPNKIVNKDLNSIAQRQFQSISDSIAWGIIADGAHHSKSSWKYYGNGYLEVLTGDQRDPNTKSATLTP